MQILILLAIHAVMLLTVGWFFVASHQQWGRVGSLALVMILFIFSDVFINVAKWIPVHICFLMIFGCLIGKETSRRKRVIGTGIISIAMLILPAWCGLQSRSDLCALRAEYPIASLESRLAYEESSEAKLGTFYKNNSTTVSGLSDSESAQNPTDLVLSSAAKTRLTTDEDASNSYSFRSHMLKQLHSKNAADYALADGFGMGTGLRPSHRNITLPEPEAIPFENIELKQPSYEEVDGLTNRATPPKTQTETTTGNSISSAPAESALHATHQSSLRDFLDVERFGYVAAPQLVAGFEPHAFQQPARVHSDSSQSTAEMDHTWAITRLELVSLLKFDEPRVYVSDVLPNMKELSQVETRPLSAFEAEGLPQLVSQKDVVISEREGEIRMLGSLRATEQCLNCHTVERGYLLGAFSYHLQRAR